MGDGGVAGTGDLPVDGERCGGDEEDCWSTREQTKAGPNRTQLCDGGQKTRLKEVIVSGTVKVAVSVVLAVLLMLTVWITQTDW